MSSRKSFIAKIEEFILKSTKPDYMDSEDKVNDFLKERLNSQEKAPKSIFKSIDLNGNKTFVYGNKKAKNIIVYIHGGAFVNEINYQHHLFCFLLSKKMDAYVIAPVYPLAPKYSYDKTFEIITDLYKSLIGYNQSNSSFESNDTGSFEGEDTGSFESKNLGLFNDINTVHKKITFMGDSAGGGFVLSFCQYLKEIELPQPDNIIVFSPWVDISLGNSPYDSDSDPILGEIGLRKMGKSWAGDLDTQNYKVSPLYGDNHGFSKTLIFVGENEIFHKDILMYYDKLKEDNVDVKLVVGNGMFHIYPLFPCPEARDAFKELKKEFE